MTNHIIITPVYVKIAFNDINASISFFSFQSTERLTLDQKKKRKTIKTLRMQKLLKNETC